MRRELKFQSADVPCWGCQASVSRPHSVTSGKRSVYHVIRNMSRGRMLCYKISYFTAPLDFRGKAGLFLFDEDSFLGKH